jgi:contractile injection system tube protein
MALHRAKLIDVSSAAVPSPEIEVQFNPSDLTIDSGAVYASMPVPGLQTPIQQFIRGDADTLTLELFVDDTSSRNQNSTESVKAKLDQLRKFVRIDKSLHAPPICKFVYGDLDFTGTVVSLRERHTLFSPSGNAIRARVTLVLKKYKSAEVQHRELALESPDRTHIRVLREGETLATLAYEAYGDPRMWRPIAEANGIERPRFIAPGTALKIPAI